MRALFLSALLLPALFACGKPPPPTPTLSASAFQLTDIGGADIGKDFRLTDHTGKPRSLADFKGKVVAIFFGYTHCPDVCPTTLGDLALAMKKLGKQAERVQVLFVTVDPQRDTQALLAQYVPSFHPSFLGLYGDAEATALTAKTFKIIYQKELATPEKGGKTKTPASDAANYLVDHSAGTYLYDPQGRIRLYAGHGNSADVFVHDIRELLKP